MLEANSCRALVDRDRRQEVVGLKRDRLLQQFSLGIGVLSHAPQTFAGCQKKPYMEDS